MKTLAKYHACNHRLIGEKAFYKSVYLSGPISYRDFRETGPWTEIFHRNDALVPLLNH